MDTSAPSPRILTNMAFWQSKVWMNSTTSIYPLDGRANPAPMPWREEVLALWRGARDADIVVTQGARESLAYGLLCLATGRASRQVMTEVFIDHARVGSLAWRIKTSLFRLIARRAFGVITNSSAEIAFIADRFNIPRSRLRFVPIETSVAPGSLPVADDGYILAAGRSHRDYPILLRAAAAIDRPIHIVCGADDLVDAQPPPNVTVRRELDRAAYLEELRRCSLVAIPLVPKERSTGQVVALEAMSLGKPVVCTRVPGTIDYITDGRNGLLVEPGDPDALAAAIRRVLDTPALRSTLVQNALADIAERHTTDGHATQKLAAITDLWRSGS